MIVVAAIVIAGALATLTLTVGVCLCIVAARADAHLPHPHARPVDALNRMGDEASAVVLDFDRRGVA